MKNNIIVRTEKDYKVSKWSGGDTTDLEIFSCGSAVPQWR